MKKTDVALLCLAALISFATCDAQATGFTRIVVKLASEGAAASGGEFALKLESLVSDGAVLKESPVFGKLLNEKSVAASGGDGFPYSLYRQIIVDESSDISAESILSDIDRLASVEYAEPDRLIELFEVPNDPHLENQWGLWNVGQEYLGIVRIAGFENDSLVMKSGISGAHINPGPVWDDDQPGPKPLVVIIDTGLDTEHPDIIDNLWTNPLEVPDNGIDDDHNGYVDDWMGWDFSGDESDLSEDLVGDNDVSDDRGHGTHCAGIAGAVSNNGMGVAGVCPYPDILALKIFPNALMTVAGRAIIYAADIGGEVVNMSWGSPYESQFLEDALNYAKSKGVLLVAASGNTGDDSRHFPAALDMAMTVGASNSDDEVTFFSTYGDPLDMIAPGRDILSLRAQGTDMYAENGEPELRIVEGFYYLADGTSMAAPHVVGAAATVLSYAPGLDPDSLQAILQRSADDIVYPYGDTDSIFPGWDRYSGHGRLNLGAAIAMVSGRMAKIQYPYHGEPITENVEVSGYAYSDLSENYVLRIAPVSDMDDWSVVGQGPADVADGPLGYLDISGLVGDYILELAVGSSYSVRKRVVILSESRFEVTSPGEQEIIEWFLTVRGSILDPEFERYAVDIRSNDDPGATWVNLVSSTEFVSDTIICAKSVGEFRSGSHTIRVTMTTASGDQVREINIQIEDKLVGIFPRPGAMDSTIHFSPSVFDLNGDGEMEIAVGGVAGVSMFRSDGGAFCCGWPNLFGVNCYSAPAVADMDGDGLAEVAVVSEDGLHLFDAYGAKIDSFPKYQTTGLLTNSYPIPLLEDFDDDGIMEAAWIAESGNVYAYRLNGRSYFASLNGLFAETESGYYFGSYVPFISSVDFEGDGTKELVAAFSSHFDKGAVYVWNTLDGQALAGNESARIRTLAKLRGICIADFDADGVYDIAAVGRTETDTVFAAIIDHHGNYHPGWPQIFPDKWNVIVNPPAAADLNDDGYKELVFTISSLFNKGEICALKHDGEPYRPLPSGDGSWLVTVNGSLGSPVIGDVSGDGKVDIVVRAGSVLPSQAHERIFAFDSEGKLIDGWPIYTFASPAQVTSRMHTPALTDIDSDGELDIVSTSDDGQVYVWRLEVPFDPDKIPWGQFMHDSRHTGVLPGRGSPIAADDPVDDGILPTDFTLSQNYPNPFNPATKIEFYAPRSGAVKIEIFNLLGQKVRTLYEGEVKAGRHSVTWDGTDGSGEDVASGLYFYRMEASASVETRKMVKLK